jgi:single-strand DNA-binding protein
MASFNRIQIGGWLSKDLELTFTPTGKAVGKTAIATNKKFGDKETTTWFRLTIWGEKAQKLQEYLTKGQHVWVSGELEQQEYQDREGNSRTSLEVNVSDLQLLGSKGDGTSKAKAASAGGETATSVSDDEIPF